MHRYLPLLLLVCSPFVAASEWLIEPPAMLGSAQPRLSGGDGQPLVLSWLEPRGEGVVLQFSQLRNEHWSSPQAVASGNNWFVNWADFPSVTPLTDTVWAAHWLVKRPGGPYAYDVAIARSNDAGETFGAAQTPHQDGTATEHGFVSLFAADGGVGAVWLDGRQTTGGHEHGEHGGPMTLRWGWQGDGVGFEEQLIDDRVCDCCPTAAALGPKGPMVVYRNRTKDEIRDIYLSRRVNGEWLPGQPVANDGWQVAGCPVNGPAIATRSAQVAVAWFTAADDRPRVQVAQSANGGVQFDSPRVLDTDHPVGRMDVAITPDGQTFVSWLRKDGSLMVQGVSDQQVTRPIAVTRTAATRLSGMPQLAAVGNHLWLAWTQVEPSTDDSTQATRVMTARLPLPQTLQEEL